MVENLYWFGGYAMRPYKRYKGWVLYMQLKVVFHKSDMKDVVQIIFENELLLMWWHNNGKLKT